MRSVFELVPISLGRGKIHYFTIVPNFSIIYMLYIIWYNTYFLRENFQLCLLKFVLLGTLSYCWNWQTELSVKLFPRVTPHQDGLTLTRWQSWMEDDLYRIDCFLVSICPQYFLTEIANILKCMRPLVLKLRWRPFVVSLCFL